MNYLWILILLILAFIGYNYFNLSPVSEVYTNLDTELADAIYSHLKTGHTNFASYSQILRDNQNIYMNLGKYNTYKTFAENNNLTIDDVYKQMTMA